MIGLSAILSSCSTRSNGSPPAWAELYIKVSNKVECFYNGEIRFPNGVAVSSLESFSRYSLQVTPGLQCTNSKTRLEEVEIKPFFGSNQRLIAVGVEAELEHPNWSLVHGERSGEFTAILPIQKNDNSVSSLHTKTGDLAVRAISLSVTFPNNETIGGSVTFE